jgi:hypothetical protein
VERRRGFRGGAAAGLGRLFSALALGGVLLAAACSSTPRVPLRVVRWQVGEGPPEALFVLLPGRWDRPEDFQRQGFLASLAAAGWRAQVWGCDLHVGYFRQGSAAQRLGEDVLARIPPSLRECTFLVGISMGGLGAILADDAFPGPWKLVLLAPYLGGGKQGRRELAAQAPSLGEGNPLAPQLASWLQTRAPQKRLWLGFGAQDPYALGHRFLAAELPSDQVVVLPGGHDWPTWRELFRTLLRRLPRHPCPP